MNHGILPSPLLPSLFKTRVLDSASSSLLHLTWSVPTVWRRELVSGASSSSRFGEFLVDLLRSVDFFSSDKLNFKMNNLLTVIFLHLGCMCFFLDQFVDQRTMLNYMIADLLDVWLDRIFGWYSVGFFIYLIELIESQCLRMLFCVIIFY